ncbi:hypothetical protein A0256_10475 [Mucilaginibacter sp. PAMC 26640]|nr:hypothetical protein A0256_10475 [Mucilaginibacter sp. PAMC 26640]
MKRVLIISPYFPPVNAADMHRVRTSLPYFKHLDWEAEVVIVDPFHTDMAQDELLLQSIPADLKIHKVKAFDKSWTSKLGLGSIALRALWYYKKYVTDLMRRSHFDLIYFSTTQFPVCILGAYWKKKFKVPYVIDMQDPWHSDYYRDKPKNQRPKKYWFSYRLNKWLEPMALKGVNGLISVSPDYIADLKLRYREIENVPGATITFGFFTPDLPIALQNQQSFENVLGKDTVNIVYIGRGGADLHRAIAPVFAALQKGLTHQPELFGHLKFYFIGTSYAPKGMGTPTILPLAAQYGVEKQVVELTDRVSYYHTLNILQQADALFIPGSDDPKYTASKLYPYLLTKKPLLAIFHPDSPAVNTLKSCTTDAVLFTLTDGKESLYQTLEAWGKGIFKPIELSEKIENYNAAHLAAQQVALFVKAINYFERTHTNA